MKKPLLLAVLLVCNTGLMAQSQKNQPILKQQPQPENVTNLAYQFNLSTATFEFLSGATSLTGSQVWDDPTIPITLPFSMDFMGISSNLITIDGLGGTLFIENMATMEEVVLAPFGADIIDRGYDLNTPLSPISYKIDGTAPNRIAKIEWKEVGSYEEYATTGGTLAMYISFQMWLYEGSNIIEYRFGANTITNPTLFYEGETGAIIGMARFGTGGEVLNLLTGPAASPTLGTTENAITGTPPNGTVYRFTPATSSVAEKALHQMLKAYPNPSQGDLTLAYNGQLQTELYLTDLRGQRVKTITLHPGQQNIGLHDLAEGMYLLQLKGSPGSMRIVKN